MPNLPAVHTDSDQSEEVLQLDLPLQGLLPKKKRQPDHLYIVVVNSKNLYKIGVTSSPKTRFNQLQTASPDELFMYTIKINNAINEEKLLHRVFAHKRQRGEWYALTIDEALVMFGAFWYWSEAEKCSCDTCCGALNGPKEQKAERIKAWRLAENII